MRENALGGSKWVKLCSGKTTEGAARRETGECTDGGLERKVARMSDADSSETHYLVTS